MPFLFDLLIMFVSVYLTGLALNLTPCVYPMISVTVSVLGANQDAGRFKAFLRALVYVLGLSTMFSVLGFAAAIGGALFGAMLQNPWVLTAAGLFILALALSMLGFYTLRFPSGVLSALSKRRVMNWLGIYLAGMMVGIFAAPCIGPPVVALMTLLATKGDALFAFLIFFVMALGLGTPYLVLGTFSGLLKRLPRSGTWLVWVEKFFGFILLVVAAFYLIAAWAPYLMGFLLPCSLVTGGLFLGFWVRSAADKPSFRYTKRALGVLAVVIGILSLVQPPRERVQWESYSPAKLAAAAQAKRPVVIDFYADWCIPCHELERFTYSNRRVIEALDLFVRLKVDLTQPDAPDTMELVRQYNVFGVPTAVFLDPFGREIEEARISGFVSPDEMLSVLNSISDATA
ncbi:MAG: cytochrome c biogenesis protein CcdA [Candidatus Omnitrophota bacterium]|jgi:thiol:disulfide interchange protein DsbD